MSVKVIGLGLPRTGTTSLKNALEHLGYAPCYHITETVMHNRPFNHNHVYKWVDAFKAESESTPIPWEEMLENYQALCDYPTSPYYKNLIAHYPDAKFILTLRDDEQSWLASYKVLRSNHKHVRRVSRVFQRAQKLMEMIDFLDHKLYGDDQSDENLLAVYQQYNDSVLRELEGKNFLVMRPSEGWEPLCQFLEIPVPRIKYPTSNEGSSLGWRIPKALSAMMMGKSSEAETLLNHKSKEEITSDS